MQEEVPMDLSFEVLDLTLQFETLKSKAVVLSHDKSKSADKLKEVCLCLYVMAHEYAPEDAILHASMTTIRSSAGARARQRFAQCLQRQNSSLGTSTSIVIVTT